jgi:hypothetical protein
MMKWMMHSHNADLPSLNLGFGSSATMEENRHCVGMTAFSII